MENKKKIYGFNNGGSPGWMVAAAIGEDGVFLASHVCSSEGFMPHDLGVTSNWKHEIYDKHFGAGKWEIEFIPYSEVENHEGLQSALKLYNENASAENVGNKAHIEMTLAEG